jgi:hypothetical protein
MCPSEKPAPNALATISAITASASKRVVLFNCHLLSPS